MDYVERLQELLDKLDGLKFQAWRIVKIIARDGNFPKAYVELKELQDQIKALETELDKLVDDFNKRNQSNEGWR